MDFGRQLIRFSLPGGLFGLLAAVYLECFREAWKVFGMPEDPRHPSVLDPVTQNFIATAIGLLIAGFIIYQAYYLFYRPQPRLFGVQLWVPKDRGGDILVPLNKIPGLAHWIEEHFDASLPSAVLPFQASRSSPGERAIWYENNALVRALLSFVAERNGAEIKRDVDYRADMYHALGACRMAVGLAGAIAVGYATVIDHHSYLGNLLTSLAVTAIIVVASSLLYATFRKNRKNAWYALTALARQGLYSWFTSSPDSPVRLDQVKTGMPIGEASDA